jgi:hypothetical protein
MAIVAFDNFLLFTIFIMIILSMSYIWLSFKNSLYKKAGIDFNFSYLPLLKLNFNTFLFLLFYFYFGPQKSDDLFLFVVLSIRTCWDQYYIINNKEPKEPHMMMRIMN